MEKDNLKATTNWANTSEVTALFAGSGISITDDGTTSTPTISSLLTAGNGISLNNNIISLTTKNARTFYYSNSLQTWTVPTGVTSAKFTLVGGGGGGGGGSGTSSSCNSGGGAGATVWVYLTVIPGTQYTIAPGQGGASNSIGVTTYIKIGTTITYQASGGYAGASGQFSTNGGVGGAASAAADNLFSIAGGSAGMPVGIPINNGVYYMSSAGGSSTLGGAGLSVAAFANVAPATNTTAFTNGQDAVVNSGSGGGGGITATTLTTATVACTGGKGGGGVVIIEY